MRINPFTAVCSALVLSCGFASSYAQTITGSVTGVVTDPTGAVVSGAKVTATNVGTGVATSATTNGAGLYDIRFLQIGQYKITFENAGFKGLSTAPFTLEVNQVAKIDGKLTTGEASETVSVVNELQPLLDTDNSTISTTFTANTLSNLPLNGRNFSSVTMFLPGAVSTEPTSMTGTNAIERSTNQGGQVSINGNRN